MTDIEDVARLVESYLPERDAFERAYGKTAAALLELAPHVVRMLHRMVLDVEVPAAARRQLALAVVYATDARNFLGEAHRPGAMGFIDDLWLLMFTLDRVAAAIPESMLRKHWKGNEPFSQMLAMAHTHDALEKHVPSRVLGLLRQYLGEN